MGKRRKRTNKNVPAKGRLRDMADQLWSIAIRDDWNYRCAVCNGGNCDSHHLIPRQHELYRYDLNNGMSLCRACHQFDGNHSPHQNAAGWLKWLRENQHDRYLWYTAHTESNEVFRGTKNAAYYIAHIRRLRQYVDDAEYERVVGVRFARWLEDNGDA